MKKKKSSASHKRQGIEVRDKMKAYWETAFAITAKSVGELARAILLDAFRSVKAGKPEEKVVADTQQKIAGLLGLYVAGQKKMLWLEIKNLYEKGVIKQAALISYLMEHDGRSREEAIRYLAETFGMNPKTQSVYLSDEFILRQKEKTRKRRPDGT